MIREQIVSTLNRLKVAEKMKELQQTLQKLKASLQSMRPKDDDAEE